MAKIGRRVKKIHCRCVRSGITNYSRRHKDKKGEYLLCPECKRRYYT